MTKVSDARHQFPPNIIRHAVWLYLRFTLSYRDVVEMLAERGLDLTYETVRRCVENSSRCLRRNYVSGDLSRAAVGTWTKWS